MDDDTKRAQGSRTVSNRTEVSEMAEPRMLDDKTEREKLRQALALMKEVQSSSYVFHMQVAKAMCASIEAMIEQLDRAV